MHCTIVVSIVLAIHDYICRGPDLDSELTVTWKTTILGKNAYEFTSDK